MPKVVTCILQYKNKILILKRSNKVGTYKEMWGGVAGFVEENATLPKMFATALVLHQNCS